MRDFFTKSGVFFAQGGISGLFVAVALIILIAINAIFTTLEYNYGWQSDLSHGELYSLTDDTKTVLDKIDSKINIYTLYSPGNNNKSISALLSRYEVENSKINTLNIDPSGDRTLIDSFESAKELDAGSIIVEGERSGRAKVLPPGSLYTTDPRTGQSVSQVESKITAAIEYVYTGVTHNIRLLYGHQETDEAMVSKFISTFDTKNYEISIYDYLRSAAKLDPKMDTLLAISPKTDIPEAEMLAIEEFLQQGGTLILLLDMFVYDEGSGEVLQAKAADTPNLDAFLSRWGVLVKDEIIIGADASSTSLRSTGLIVTADNGQSVVLSECAPISLMDSGIAKPILYTPDMCYTGRISSDNSVFKREKADGPCVVGTLSKKDGGTLALFSSSSFISNYEFDIAKNSAYISRILRYSGSGAPSVSIPPKYLSTGSIEMPSGFLRILTTIIVIVVIPSGILILGVYIYMRRKRS